VAGRLAAWASSLLEVAPCGPLTAGQGDTPDLGGRRRVENPRLGGCRVPFWEPKTA